MRLKVAPRVFDMFSFVGNGNQLTVCNGQVFQRKPEASNVYSGAFMHEKESVLVIGRRNQFTYHYEKNNLPCKLYPVVSISRLRCAGEKGT